MEQLATVRRFGCQGAAQQCIASSSHRRNSVEIAPAPAHPAGGAAAAAAGRHRHRLRGLRGTHRAWGLQRTASASPAPLLPASLHEPAGLAVCPPTLQAHAHAAHRHPASLWLRVSGVTPGAPSLRGARLEVNAELAALLGVELGPESEQHPAGQQEQEQQRDQQPGPAQHPGGQLLQQLSSSGTRELLAQRLEEAPSLPAFLVELQNLVDQASLAAAQQ